MNQQLVSNNAGINNQLGVGNQQNNLVVGNSELDQLTKDTINLMNNLKVVSKKVEIVFSSYNPCMEWYRFCRWLQKSRTI